MSSDYLKPSSKNFRQPTSNAKQNGNVMNPPRYPEIGGFTSAAKGPSKNGFSVKAPK